MTQVSIEQRELARLQKLMNNPRYWKLHEPSIVEEVRAGFHALYGDQPETARADGGQTANDLGVNGPVHAQDT